MRDAASREIAKPWSASSERLDDMGLEDLGLNCELDTGLFQSRS